MHQGRQRRNVGEKEIMSLLMVSGTAIMPALKLKSDHDTVNGIMNGYYPSGRMLTYLEFGATTREDAYAEPSDRFSDFHTAISRMLSDWGFEVPRNSQISLFEEIE